MAKRASIADTDAVNHFRAQLVKFADELRVALADAEGEIGKTLHWLEGPAPQHWQMQGRKLTEQVNQAKAQVRQKKMFKSPTGATPSAAAEEHLLKQVQRKLEHTEQKLAATRKWRRELDKEVLMYRSAARRASDIVDNVVPRATADIDRALDAIQQYLALNAPQTQRPTAEASDAASIARPTDAFEPDVADETQTDDIPEANREDRP